MSIGTLGPSDAALQVQDRALGSSPRWSSGCSVTSLPKSRGHHGCQRSTGTNTLHNYLNTTQHPQRFIGGSSQTVPSLFVPQKRTLSTVNMATLLMARSALRRNIVPMSLGLTASVLVASRHAPLRLDARIPAASRPVSTDPRDNLNPDIIKQLSSGSLAGMSASHLQGRLVANISPGFVTGVVISLFSKTLVLLAGIGIVAIEVSTPPIPARARARANLRQIASRYGINLVDVLKLRKMIDSSKVLRSLNKNPVFKLSFGVTFALAAFASF